MKVRIHHWEGTECQNPLHAHARTVDQLVILPHREGSRTGHIQTMSIFFHVHVHMHATHTHTQVADSIDAHLITPSVGDILASEDSSAASEISSVPG